MNYEIKKAVIKSCDGKHTLNGVLYIPNQEIKGLFHIVHGMTEHIARYDHIMSAAAENGYLCFGYDNLGHGKTAQNDDELGFIASENGWEYLVDDTYNFERQVMKLYPDKPLIVMGHSMGSFIVRLSALRYGKYYNRLILCGTGGPNPLSLIGLALTKLIKKIKGDKHVSPLINSIAFGAYNKRFEKDSKYNWLTKERSEIEKYSNDKFCTFPFTVSAMQDLIMLNALSNSKTFFYELRRDMPILLISGEDDPVGNYGKGVQTVYNKLKANRVKSVVIKLYKNCRHEILNDTCRQEVIKNILSFISEKY